MGKKLYNGISGLLRIICAVYISYFSVELVIENMDVRLLVRDVGSEWIPMQYFLVVLGFALLLGQIVRGGCQILSIAKPKWENRATACAMDWAVVIWGLLSCLVLSETLQDLNILIQWYNENSYIDIWFWAFLALALLDAIVLHISSKEKIRPFSKQNRLQTMQGFSLLIIPVLLIFLGFTMKDMIQDNLELQRINTAAQGGFDSFTIYDLDGNECTEEILRGHKVTMINIWGTYCGPCIREMPELQEISQSYDPADLQIIGIPGNLYPAGEIDMEELEKVDEIILENGVTYPILIPTAEFQASVIDEIVFAFPTTIFVNEKGEELHAVVSARQKAAWIDIIEEVIAGEK